MKDTLIHAKYVKLLFRNTEREVIAVSLALVREHSVRLKAWLGCDGWLVPEPEESASWEGCLCFPRGFQKVLFLFLLEVPQSWFRAAGSRVWVLGPGGGHVPRVCSWGLN